MFQTGTGKDASHDLAMLDDVSTFKERYYRSSKARYDLAVPGTLMLVPPETISPSLATDYRGMRMMFFEEPPSFDRVLGQLRALQQQVNGSHST
jgi:hypothetical protein